MLSPGESTSFEIGIDALTEGNFAGGISFGSNDSDEDPFDIQLTASVTPPPTSQIVDNGDPGGREHRELEGLDMGRQLLRR